MKLNKLVYLCLFLVVSNTVFAEDKFLEPFSPLTPEVKAQGGAFTAIAKGYNAFFINPAGFAYPNANITFLSATATGNVALSKINAILANLSAIQSGVGDIQAFATNTESEAYKITDTLLTKTGVGAQAGVGFGWVGSNLGIGFASDTKVFAIGSTFLGVKPKIDSTNGFVLGGGIPLDLGFMNLKIGGAIRPMQRIYSESNGLTELTKGDLSKIKVYSGFGTGLDLGALATIGEFSMGLTMKDIGSTLFGFKEYNLKQVIDSMGFPSGGTGTGEFLYRIPMSVATGLAWKPDMGALQSLVEPTVQMDLQIPLKTLDNQPSFWTWTHIGVEAKFLSIVALRTGLNQGNFTFGMGFTVPFFDLNLAIYADELGQSSGSNRRPAIALETAIRL